MFFVDARFSHVPHSRVSTPRPMTRRNASFSSFRGMKREKRPCRPIVRRGPDARPARLKDNAIQHSDHKRIEEIERPSPNQEMSVYASSKGAPRPPLRTGGEPHPFFQAVQGIHSRNQTIPFDQSETTIVGCWSVVSLIRAPRPRPRKIHRGRRRPALPFSRLAVIRLFRNDGGISQ